LVSEPERSKPGPIRVGDAQLVEAFLRGDAQAVALLNRWIAGAASPFYRRLSSEWDDVLQDSRLTALRLLQQGKYRGEASLKTYLWQVVGHLCIDLIRRQRRRPTADTDPVEAGLVSAAPSPFDRVALRERDERLLDVLDSMSAECRQVWSMILEGLSYRDMSLRLHLAEGTLRVRAHRCLKLAVDALTVTTPGYGTPKEQR
jgi:RNA polymerase sigma factor (sigma-70 family)